MSTGYLFEKIKAALEMEAVTAVHHVSILDGTSDIQGSNIL